MTQDTTSINQPLANEETLSARHSSEGSYRIISPRISKEDFLRVAAKQLVMSGMNEDFIDCIDTQNVKLKYLCYCRIKGTVDCHWSCRTARDESVEHGGRVITIEAGAPVSGIFDNQSFDAAFPLCGACNNTWAKDADILVFDESDLANCEDEIDESDIYGQFDENFMELVQNEISNVVDFCLADKVKSTAQNSANLYRYAGIMSDDEAEQYATESVPMCEWNITASNVDLQDIGQKILVPYYVLDINYNGEAYYISIPAIGGEQVNVSLPMTVRRSIEDLLASEIKKSQYYIFYALAAVCIVMGFLFLQTGVSIKSISGFSLFLIGIYFCGWIAKYVVRLLMKDKINNKRDELIALRQAQQQRIAQKLKAKFQI